MPGETRPFDNDHAPRPRPDPHEARYAAAVASAYRQREPGAIAIDFIRR
jgi:hypothetical protein